MVRDWPAKFVVADVPPANSAHLHVGAVPSSQFGIALGSDGALWFTEGANNKIGRITTAARSPSFRSRPRTTPRMGSRRGLTGRCGSPSSPTRSGGSPPLARSGEFPLSTTAGRIRSWRGLTGRCGSPTPTPRSGGSRPTAAGRPRPSPPPGPPTPGPAPGPRPVIKPGVAVVPRTAQVTGGKAAVLLSCPRGKSGCSGTLTLASQRVTIRRQGRRPVITHRVRGPRQLQDRRWCAPHRPGLAEPKRPQPLAHARSHRLRVTAAIGRCHRSITLVQSKPRKR